MNAERERILNARYRRAQKAKGYRQLRLERQIARDMMAAETLDNLREMTR